MLHREAEDEMTKERIKALRNEAEAAGDTKQVEICDLALGGDAAAWAGCERAAADEAAMREAV